MTERQLPLFSAQPTTTDDLSSDTSVEATFMLFRDYLLNEGKSQHTVKAFIGDLRLLVDYAGTDVAIGVFDTAKLNQFLKWMEFDRGVPCSRKTYARRVTTLKVYFKWLDSLGVLIADPAKALVQRSGPAPLSKVLNEAQAHAAIEHAETLKKGDQQDHRPAFLFQLLLETGIKKSEAARLKATDFDRSNASMPVLTIRHRAKNVYKERRIVVKPELMTLMDTYLAQYDPGETVFDCTPRNLEYILTDVGEGAGIPFKLSFEVMRWTSALRDYRDGIEPERIREKMGLSKISWYETGKKIQRLADMQITEEQKAN